LIVMELGNMGSGKSASMVREILSHPGRTYFSNIITHRSVKNNHLIKPEMIFNKEPIIKADGSPVISKGEPQYKLSVNKEFWQEAVKRYGEINVIIDEAHIILNARRSMSKKTQVVLDWMALLRRVLGASDSRLILVTQIERRLDIVAKEQATDMHFNIMHYRKSCPACGKTWRETNEDPEPVRECPKCGKKIVKHSFIVEKWHFKNYNDFIMWKYMGQRKTYYKHYLINDIEKVFPYYDTLQWENLLVE